MINNKTIANRWRKWAEALTSGKYKQGKNFLKRKDKNNNIKMCCLGVACDLKGLRGKEIKEASIVHFEFNKNEEEFLPKRLQEWLNISKDGGFSNIGKEYFNKNLIKNREYSDSLTVMNDSNYTFKQIAKFLNAAADKLEFENINFFESPNL